LGKECSSDVGIKPKIVEKKTRRRKLANILTHDTISSFKYKTKQGKESLVNNSIESILKRKESARATFSEVYL